MGKRTRLEIYDEYPSTAIADAIDEWIKDHDQRIILKLKLVDCYTFQKTAELASKELEHFIDVKTVMRQVYKAESILFPRLQIIYKGKEI